jgi:hypothetical protein
MSLVHRCRRHNGRLHKIRTMRMRQAAGAGLKFRKSTGWLFRERDSRDRLSASH